jgi:hypothetical protein
VRDGLPGGVRLPAYGTGSLADLLPAVLASLEVPGERDVLGLAPTGRAVVLLVDGLGAALLRRHADAAPFLTSLTSRDLTAGFPSTTVTSLASFGTGLPPGEHGLPGYTSWVEEVEQTVGWLGGRRSAPAPTCASSWCLSWCSRGRPPSSALPQPASR